MINLLVLVSLRSVQHHREEYIRCLSLFLGDFLCFVSPTRLTLITIPPPSPSHTPSVFIFPVLCSSSLLVVLCGASPFFCLFFPFRSLVTSYRESKQRKVHTDTQTIHLVSLACSLSLCVGVFCLLSRLCPLFL